MEHQAWQKCWKLKYRLYRWIYAAPCYKWVENCVYIACGEANTGCKVEIYICVTWNSIWYVVQPEKYIGWKYRFARFSENVRNETDARHEPVSRRDDAMLGWSSIIIYEGYIGDCFDRIPGIVSQARRHLHDTELEVIERIHRRLGNSLFLVNHFTVILVFHFVRDNGLNSRRVEISMWGDWDETMSGKQAVRGENPYNNFIILNRYNYIKKPMQRWG